MHPLLQRLLDGQIALRLDATSQIFGVSPHLSFDADLVGYSASILGAIAVLVAGSIWRKRRLQHLEKLALPAAVEIAQPIDQP